MPWPNLFHRGSWNHIITCLGSQLTSNVVCAEDSAYIIKLKKRGLTQRGRNTDTKPLNSEASSPSPCWTRVTHSLLEGSLQTKNPKPFWRYIKSRKQESTGISTIKIRGLLVSDNTQQAEILNEQLSQYFRKKTPLHWVRRWSLPEHARIEHRSDWCGEVIAKFKSRQSLGPRQCT